MVGLTLVLAKYRFERLIRSAVVFPYPAVLPLIGNKPFYQAGGAGFR